MKVNSLNLSICVFLVLSVLLIAYIRIPIGAVPLYNLALRPLVYALMMAVVLAFIGIDKRPVRHAYVVNMLAVLSVAAFGMVVIAVSFLFGAGVNIMFVNPDVVIRNLWEFGALIIIGEIIRYKLIKKANDENRAVVTVILTVAFAFLHMHAGLRALFSGGASVTLVFFESIFTPLVISAAVSFYAAKGNIIAVLLLSFVLNMAAYLLPILPNIPAIAFSLLLSFTAFASAMLLGFFSKEKSRAFYAKQKQAALYAKKPFFDYMITVTAIVVIAAFFTGVFPIYPLVILTGSMEPVIERGSMVFVERVPYGQALEMVGEGEVIHFLGQHGMEYVHRVVGHWYDHHGQRLYITQGDASEITDPFPVPQGNVIGIVRATLPFFGYPYIFFRAVFSGFN